MDGKEKMSQLKKRGLRGEKIDRLKIGIKEVKKHKRKVLLTLSNLEKWFAQGKVNYTAYQEKKEHLLELTTEYNIYLHRAKREIKILEED